MYTLYANPGPRVTLAANHRLRGEHHSGGDGPDFALAAVGTTSDASLWCGHGVTRVGTLAFFLCCAILTHAHSFYFAPDECMFHLLGCAGGVACVACTIVFLGWAGTVRLKAACRGPREQQG